MKKIGILALILCICVMLSGCAFILNEVIDDTKKEFNISDYDLTITATSAFESVNEDGPFDLQIYNDDAYISVMAYKYIDLPEGDTPDSIYVYHNEDIFSRRENVKAVKEKTVETLDNKTVTKTLYSAENEGTKNYYYSFLIDFTNDGTFAWVLITGMPSYIEKNSAELENIVLSLEVNNTGTQV